MANQSRWKNWEKEVAEALGGKRRHRTMGSYATEATDVRFSNKAKKKHPELRRCKVECKKRRKLDVVTLFANASAKYGGNGKDNVILATKRPVGQFKKAAEKLRERIEKRYAEDGPVYKQRMKRLSRLLKQLGKEKDKRTKKKIQKKIRKLKRRIKHLKKDFYKKLKWETKQLRAEMSNTGLVTVTLEFFKELWDAWLLSH